MTGVCRICGHSFSTWDIDETVCPSCRCDKNWDRIRIGNDSLNNYDSTHLPATLGSSRCSLDSINTVSAENSNLPVLIIMAQKIVLENGGIQLVIDNDTIKSIGSIEVNGIKFGMVKE